MQTIEITEEAYNLIKAEHGRSGKPWTPIEPNKQGMYEIEIDDEVRDELWARCTEPLAESPSDVICRALSPQN